MNILDLIKEWQSNNPNLELPIYSPLFGDGVVKSADKNIQVQTPTGIYVFDADGRYNGNGSTILFPSSGSESWTDFDTSSSLCPFKQGQIVSNGKITGFVSKEKTISFLLTYIYENKVHIDREIIKWKEFIETPSKILEVSESLGAFGYKIENNSLVYDASLLHMYALRKQIEQHDEAIRGETSGLMEALGNLKSELNAINSKLMTLQVSMRTPRSEEPQKESYMDKFVLPAVTVVAVVAICLILYHLIIGAK